MPCAAAVKSFTRYLLSRPDDNLKHQCILIWYPSCHQYGAQIPPSLMWKSAALAMISNLGGQDGSAVRQRQLVHEVANAISGKKRSLPGNRFQSENSEYAGTGVASIYNRSRLPCSARSAFESLDIPAQTSWESGPYPRGFNHLSFHTIFEESIPAIEDMQKKECWNWLERLTLAIFKFLPEGENNDEKMTKTNDL